MTEKYEIKNLLDAIGDRFQVNNKTKKIFNENIQPLFNRLNTNTLSQSFSKIVNKSKSEEELEFNRKFKTLSNLYILSKGIKDCIQKFESNGITNESLLTELTKVLGLIEAEKKKLFDSKEELEILIQRFLIQNNNSKELKRNTSHKNLQSEDIRSDFNHLLATFHHNVEEYFHPTQKTSEENSKKQKSRKELKKVITLLAECLNNLMESEEIQRMHLEKDHADKIMRCFLDADGQNILKRVAAYNSDSKDKIAQEIGDLIHQKRPDLKFNIECLSANNNRIIKLDIPDENISLIISLYQPQALNRNIERIISEIQRNNFSKHIFSPHSFIQLPSISVNIGPCLKEKDLESIIRQNTKDLNDFERITQGLEKTILMAEALLNFKKIGIHYQDVKPGNFYGDLVSDYKSFGFINDELDTNNVTPAYHPPILSNTAPDVAQIYSLSVSLLQLFLGIRSDQLMLLTSCATWENGIPSLENDFLHQLYNEAVKEVEKIREVLNLKLENATTIEEEAFYQFELSIYDEKFIKNLDLLFHPAAQGLLELVFKGLSQGIDDETRSNPAVKLSLEAFTKEAKRQLTLLAPVHPEIPVADEAILEIERAEESENDFSRNSVDISFEGSSSDSFEANTSLQSSPVVADRPQELINLSSSKDHTHTSPETKVPLESFPTSVKFRPRLKRIPGGYFDLRAIHSAVVHVGIPSSSQGILSSDEEQFPSLPSPNQPRHLKSHGMEVALSSSGEEETFIKRVEPEATSVVDFSLFNKSVQGKTISDPICLPASAKKSPRNTY